MTKDIRKHWPWLIVPLEIETEMGLRNESWYHKKEVTGGIKCECGCEWTQQTQLENGFIQYNCPSCKLKGEFY